MVALPVLTQSCERAYRLISQGVPDVAHGRLVLARSEHEDDGLQLHEARLHVVLIAPAPKRAYEQRDRTDGYGEQQASLRNPTAFISVY